MIDETRLAVYKVTDYHTMLTAENMAECYETIEALWRVAQAARTYRMFAHVHGPEGIARMTLDAALAEVGLSGNTSSTMTASNDTTTQQK